MLNPLLPDVGVRRSIGATLTNPSSSLQWGNLTGKPYTGNPSVRFDEGTEARTESPPTLLENSESYDRTLTILESDVKFLYP